LPALVAGIAELLSQLVHLLQLRETSFSDTSTWLNDFSYAVEAAIFFDFGSVGGSRDRNRDVV
jgi:hypothetical protein